jgi:hypothetical protein
MSCSRNTYIYRKITDNTVISVIFMYAKLEHMHGIL